jgi:dienelactone hydrolase
MVGVMPDRRHRVIAMLAALAVGATCVGDDDRWPPRHEIDETVAAEALAEFRATWTDAESWRARAATIRGHIIDVLGIDPAAPRPAVPVQVRGRVEHDGYAVSNIRLETAPGLYVAGNLYEPLGRTGPFPAVLCAHGHVQPWGDHPGGRFHQEYQYLAATIARMGAVAITWDMVGWGETTWLPHHVPETTILQTWNSIRLVDFMQARPDVDPKRIAMTGASGGGTQTFLAACLDERIAVAAPVVMVSAHWFGGCPCESGLPIHAGPTHRTNNVEITACAAPRPLMLVSCGGDWTSNTPTVEAPYIGQVYKTFGVDTGMFVYAHIEDEGHDFGSSKRAAVDWFLARHLDLNVADVYDEDNAIDERPVHVLPPAALRVYDDEHPRPADAVTDHAAALAAIRTALEDEERRRADENP